MFAESCNFAAPENLKCSRQKGLNWHKLHRVLILFIIPRETLYSSKNICCKCIFKNCHWINVTGDLKSLLLHPKTTVSDASQIFFTTCPFHMRFLWALLGKLHFFLYILSHYSGGNCLTHRGKCQIYKNFPGWDIAVNSHRGDNKTRRG